MYQCNYFHLTKINGAREDKINNTDDTTIIIFHAVSFLILINFFIDLFFYVILIECIYQDEQDLQKNIKNKK